MKSTAQLFKLLPTLLRCAWALLLLGAIFLTAGFFTHTPWQSYLGLGSLIFSYTIAILDMVYRRARRDQAVGFYVGVTVAPMIGLLILALPGFLGAVALAVQTFLHGFPTMQAMKLLHFACLVLAFTIVVGVPAMALRADQGAKEPSDQRHGAP